MDKHYYGINYTDEALSHFSLPFFNRKAKESEKHKYFKREMVGKSWRYFYSRSAWETWKKGSKPAQQKPSIFARAKQAFSKVRMNVSKQVNNAARSVGKQINSVSRTVNKQVTNATKTIKKSTSTFKRAAGNLVKNISETAIAKTKKVVTKVANKFGHKSINSKEVSADALKGKQKCDGILTTIAVGVAARLAVGVGIALLLKGAEALKNKYAEYKISKRKRFKSLNDIPKQDPPKSREENLNATNPRFMKESGYDHNCQFCTTAYEMRCRGYDVEASGRMQGGTTDDLNQWYEPDPKFDHNTEICDPDTAVAATNEYYQTGNTTIWAEQAQKLRKKMLTMPEGSRGDISVTWNPYTAGGAGGHSMHFEIQNGDVIVRCAQSGQTFTLEELMPKIVTCEYARLDNLDFEEKALDCVVDKGDEDD